MKVCLAVMGIDWQLIRELVAVGGTIGALIIGVLGLSTWRRQLQGTSEYEVAKNALLATYHVRDAIQAARSPMLYLRKDEVEAGRRLEEEQRIYEERMKRVYEEWAKLRTLALESRVIWGEEAEQLFEPISKLISELRRAIWLHFWLKGAYAVPGATVDDSPERVEANNQVVYRLDDDDEFSTKLNGATDAIEAFFQRRIRG